MEAIGKYRLVRKLAEGGMAEVFLAQVEGPGGFQKPVVVKRVLPELSKDKQFVAMFLSEAKLVAQLNHPNIVQVFDFGFDQGSYFLVMEYVDGCNLRTLFKRVMTQAAVLPYEQAARMVAMACEGLAFAHSFTDDGKVLDLIHRDVSPENLLVGRNGVVKVADFGIARVAGQKRMTRTGTVRGKLVYMAPEQMMAEPVDCRVDVFALGIVLFELICGRRPFEAKTEVEAMQAILKGVMTPASTYRPDCPPEFQQIIDQAMARSPDQRYRDCTQLQAALDAFIANRGVTANAASVGKWVEKYADPKTPMPSLGTPTVILPPREVRTASVQRPSTTTAQVLLAVKPSKTPYLVAGVALGLAVVAAGWAFWPDRPPPAAVVVAPPPPAPRSVIVAAPEPPPPPPEEYPTAPPPGEPPKPLAKGKPAAKHARAAEPVAVAAAVAPVEEPKPAEPVLAKTVEPAPEPVKAEPVKAEPAKPEGPKLKGRLESSFDRGIVLFNNGAFDWSDCEVRMPNKTYFKMDGVAHGDNDNARGVADDHRPLDANMAKGWALVRCKEAAGYLWWGLRPSSAPQ